MKTHFLSLAAPAALIGLGLALFGPLPVSAADDSRAFVSALNDAFADVYEKVAPSVVVIESKQEAAPTQATSGVPDAWQFFFRGPGGRQGMEQRPNQGSGFLISSDGLIVTNNHVVEGSNPASITVTLKDGRKLPAALVGVDPKTDLALLKVEATGLPACELADSDAVRVGNFAFALGAPFELPYTFTFGLVSATGRSNLTNITYEDYIQTDASINPGNSGGPLVDIHGRVIGVNTLINGINRGLGFAIPINMVKDVATQLASTGRVIRPWLGIEIMGLEESEMLRRAFPEVDHGVVVDRIRRGAPAYQSDLRPGDVILSVEGAGVRKAKDVQRAVLSKGVGELVRLEVWRDGARKRIEILTGEQPDAFIPAVHDSSTPPVPTVPPAAQVFEQLGLEVANLTPEAVQTLRFEGRSGVLVTGVAGGSPADVAGLMPGDIVTHVGNVPVDSTRSFLRELAKVEQRQGTLILLHRDGQKTYSILKP